MNSNFSCEIWDVYKSTYQLVMMTVVPKIHPFSFLNVCFTFDRTQRSKNLLSGYCLQPDRGLVPNYSGDAQTLPFPLGCHFTPAALSV